MLKSLIIIDWRLSRTKRVVSEVQFNGIKNAVDMHC
jgi:hypothetical protein